jgi:predicted nucleic acid binding AN1-type Zn finger protein
MSEFHKCIINKENECNCIGNKLVLKRENGPKKKKCYTCSKKVGLFGIECRCGHLFCSKHRHPEDHECSFDFKNHDKDILKNNVIGGGEFKKIDKI